MKQAIRELRQRGVFRAAGLYIAAMWLILQIADVVFPAFEIPDSSLRYILFVGVSLFPFAMAFSWFYDISSEGIRSEEELRKSELKGGSGYMSGATIVVLVVALGISLYANYEQASLAVPEEPPEIISLLVSDFVNTTGDPIFDGSLEPALAIGVEGAPFISSFPRHQASAIATKISGSDMLNEENSRLVSVREGIRLILIGSISPTDDGYDFALRAVDARDGALVVEAEASADTKLEVLPAVGRLAVQIREGLGDATLQEDPTANETFTAASLEAARFYTIAQTFNHSEKNEQAAEYYEKAVEEDPEFGRAYAGWALSARKLGKLEQSKALWDKTLSLLDTMTERERYRTLGSYYATVTGDQLKAIENYKLLIEKYPADNVGRNNLAVSSFFARMFDEALVQGAELAEQHSNIPAYGANYALYAMYAGKFDIARSEAERVLAIEPGYYLAYLPLAIAELAGGDTAAATAVYERMEEFGILSASIGNMGLADIALLQGDWPAADAILRGGIAVDQENGNQAVATRKMVDLAWALDQQGKRDEALAQINAMPPDTAALSALLPAARLLVSMGELEAATAFAATLNNSLQQDRRAAADLVNALIAQAKGDTIGSIDALTASLERTDTWLGRFELGRAYAIAGYFPEALGELEKSASRIGESSALFLDDVPTFHYSAPLQYWLGLVHQELGMEEAARQNFSSFLSLRAAEDTSATSQDARIRLASIKE